MKQAFVVVLLALALVVPAIADGPNTGGKGSPEYVIRRFMASLLTSNAEGIKATILPVADAELLWQGKPPPKHLKEKVWKTFQSMEYVRVEEGETIELPDGDEMTIKRGMITANRIIMQVRLPDGRSLFPIWMHKTPKGWKVDAGPLISARKAAAKVREKRKTRE